MLIEAVKCGLGCFEVDDCAGVPLLLLLLTFTGTFNNSNQ